MNNDDFEQLLSENLDILKEIGNIGMGHTSTALAQMLSMKVTMTVPEVHILGPESTVQYLVLETEDSLCVQLNLQGDSEGIILLILSKKFALKVINFFFQKDLETIIDLDEMSLSVVQEIGNITSGAYCNSLASMTGLFIDISTPSHCPNPVEVVLSAGKSGVLKDSEKILVIKNSFFIGTEEINSNFLFIPNVKTTAMILEKLKAYYGFI